MHRHVTVTEYGCIGLKGKPADNKFISAEIDDENVFKALKSFNADNDDSIFTVTSVKAESGKRIDALRAKSLVGVIETKDGTVVEILPKIYSDKQVETTEIRKIFLRMLRFLRDSPFKDIDVAHLRTEKFPILEIFITIFLDELSRLIQKGIAKEYVNIEDNASFLKGKLLFTQHIKYNLAHKERFSFSYDEFLSDRPENRLIKSTLLFLSKKAKSNANQKRIREFIFTFDDIPASADCDVDFSKVKMTRLIKHYEKILTWCRVFLKKESFTNFKGKAISFAILFPMEKIFEDYVGAIFKRGNTSMTVSLQQSRYNLIEDHGGNPKFKLRPDITAKSKEEKVIILDTKWKLIDQGMSDKNYYISQDDIYQMFAYAEKYDSEELYLLYPQNEEFKDKLPVFEYYKNKRMTLHVCPVPLRLLAFDTDEAICKEMHLDCLRK